MTGIADGHGHVLVADDNADIREYLRRLLGRYWGITAVGDGQAALEVASSRPPDLILADVMMPRVDGLGLLRAVRARPETRGVPVILLSALGEEESRIEGLAAGADDYLVKPFSARELVARVHAHLELARIRGRALARERLARLDAERASGAKDELLAILAHDLKTQLNSILGWAVMLREGQVRNGALQHGLEVIERNARTQARLIDSMQDAARTVAGEVRLNFEQVNLASVVKAAVDTIGPAADAKGVWLHTELDSSSGMEGDAARLRQVMWHLLSNGVKFTPRGGRIEVALVGSESQIEVTVADTGSGIDPDTLPRLFDPFRHEGNPSGSRRHASLGLALVKRIVELHGGTARAESAGIGQGAKFVVTLPR